MTESVEERAEAIYDEMMAVLERRGDDEAVVRAVLTAFSGAYFRFLREGRQGFFGPEAGSPS